MGFKIALTGAVVALFMVLIVAADGRQADFVPAVKLYPVVVLCLGGGAAIFVGLLMGIWGY